MQKQQGKEQQNKELQRRMLSRPLSQLVRVVILLVSPQKHAHMHNFTLLLLFFFCHCMSLFVRLFPMRETANVCQPEERWVAVHHGNAEFPAQTGQWGRGRKEPCFYKRERGGKLPSPALASYNTSLWGFVRRTVFAPFRRRTRLAEQLAAVQEVYQTRLRWQKRLLLLSF